MPSLFRLPKQVAIDSAGRPLAGAKAYFFVTGTTTPKTVYTTSALNISHAHPVVADSEGVFDEIWIDSTEVYKLTLNRSDDTLVYTSDPVTDSFTQDDIGNVLYPRTSAEIAAGVTPTNYQYESGNVYRYGTNTTPGTTDMTAAIDAADLVMCAGTIGADGVTVKAEGSVIFPAGTLKHTGLTYRGAPWVGQGVHATTLMYYGSGASITAVGSLGARKAPNISSMTLDGTNASAGGYGIRFGHCYRSLRVLDQITIRSFPSYGILFDDNCWQLGFSDTYVVGCATGAGSGIGVSGTPTTLANINWYNLQLENNGQASSSTGGGINLAVSGVINQWAFFGGLLQGNKGAAEARFIDCAGISLDGMYLESDLAAAGAVDGLIIGGSTNATLRSPTLAAVSSHAGKCLRVIGTAKLTADNLWIHPNWPVDISVEDTAVCTLVSNGTMNDTSTVVNGAALIRQSPKRVVLTDAATIAVNAAFGTYFEVTLAGNRTMGVPTNPSVGQVITFVVTQDGTGSRTLAFDASIYKHTWSNTGNSADFAQTVQFIYEGSALRWKQLSGISGYYG